MLSLGGVCRCGAALRLVLLIVWLSDSQARMKNSNERIRELQRRFLRNAVWFIKGKTTYQETLAAVSVMALAALARTNIATVDTDCKSAFNCCIPELIRIKLLVMGVLSTFI